MQTTDYAYANAAISEEVKVFQDIHIPTKNIAIYQRSITPLKDELTIAATQAIECRTSGTPEEIIQALNDYFDLELPHCTALLEDVIGLLRIFEKTTKASSFRLLLATVASNMCRKFHTDINDLRLLCTYIGPGTVWLPDEAVNYKALDARKSNEEIVQDQEHIQKVGTGEVVLLKGALYPEANPILHRSPAIADQGIKRLILRIDTNEFLNIWNQ